MARIDGAQISLWRVACILALTILTVGCVSIAAAGQQENTAARALPKDEPAPRTSDGHPDLSGVWFPDMRQYGPPVVAAEAKEVPFQPWAAAKIAAMSPAELEYGRPSVNCAPRGTPGMIRLNPYPMKLVQTRDELIQLNELNNNFRIIPLDGRPHTKNPDPTFAGESTAHWEGDTLVIDTIAIDERTWNNFIGWFHSDQQHVVERLTRTSKNVLTYQVTIEDPKVLTRPWTSVPRQWSLRNVDLIEYHCTNNHEVDQYKSLVQQEGNSK